MRVKLSERKIVILDTETTGLDIEQHEIIEVAAILYDQSSDEIIKTFERKAQPRNIKTASKKALEINGYKENKKLYRSNIKGVVKDCIGFINGNMVMGQNIRFDISFLQKYCDEFGIKNDFNFYVPLELSSMAWLIMRKSDELGLSLKRQCDYFGISNDGEHRALADCYRTLEVYRCIIKQIN